jgi:transposase InsO family protein
MRKLGFKRFGRSTVKRILERHGLTPRPDHTGLSWHDFLSHYGEFIWACDFFTVTTASLRTYYVLAFIEITSRRITFWDVSEHPGEQWVVQQFRNLAVVHDDLPRHLIHDRDGKFAPHAGEVLRGMGTKPIRLPVRSPLLSAHCERWIRSARDECLDHIIILNERHLRWALGNFVRYYNERRPHRAKGLRLLSGHADFRQVGEVARRPILGGLINDYYRKAA